MTDKLLCPFCNKPLQPTHRIEDEYFCENYDCPQTSITWIGTSSLWKAFADTKKKLDIAVSALKYIKDGNLGLYPVVEDFAEKAIEQVNQKDE